MKNNCSNKEEIITLTQNESAALYLTENDRSFPPDCYERTNLLGDSFDYDDIPFDDENISVDNDNILFEDNNNFIKESEYEYRNDLRLFGVTENKFAPYRLFITNIEVANGKITFFLEDRPPIIIEDKFLMNSFRTDNEASRPDTYESFWGKKSILKHHFNHVFRLGQSNHWGTSYYTYNIAEHLYDGVTSFVIYDYGEFEDDIGYIEFPDGVYNRDGMKIANSIKEIDYDN